MKPEGKLAALGNFVKQLALIEIEILGLAGLICWLAGWRTFEEYANRLVWAGVAIMIFAALSFFGGNVPLGNTRYNFAATLSRVSMYDRAKGVMSNRDDNLSFVTIAGLSGLVTVVIGLILQGFIK